jgi:hypothetical protein
MGEKETRVYTANGEFEAQQMRAFLEAHGIPCEFRGEALRKTHGLTLDGLGEVEVHVPRDRVEEARELVALAEKGELRLGDDAEPEGTA